MGKKRGRQPTFFSISKSILGVDIIQKKGGFWGFLGVLGVLGGFGGFGVFRVHVGSRVLFRIINGSRNLKVYTASLIIIL